MAISGSEFLRYSRQIMLPEIGEQGQQQLAQSRVLIVGLGGLGCPVSIYLARAGVGNIILCDHDEVDSTNLQRQILYRSEHVGMAKVTAAQQELVSINPYINIETFKIKCSNEWFERLDTTTTNSVADCTDNHSARSAINVYCKTNRIPWVSASAMGWGGRIVEFHCHQQQTPCYFSLLAEDAKESTQNCATLGVVGSILGMMGSMQATAILRQLLNIDSGSHGLVSQYDAKDNQWFNYQLK